MDHRLALSELGDSACRRHGLAAPRRDEARARPGRARGSFQGQGPTSQGFLDVKAKQFFRGQCRIIAPGEPREGPAACRARQLRFPGSV
jgi:hypothetical protein